MAVQGKDMIKLAVRLSTCLRRLVNSARPSAGLCPLCLAPARPDKLCSPCESDLPALGSACAFCGVPLPVSGVACGACQKQRPAFDRVQAAFVYRFPVNPMISRFKYQGELVLAWPLIELLAQKLRHDDHPRPDILLPCPIHPRRYRKRGFNQAAVIASRLGAELGIPVDYQLCARPGETPPQAGLGRAARLQNLEGAFMVNGPVPPRVAIVDDVVTTGATAQQLAKVLKAAGAQDVSVWALARTPMA